MLFYTRQTKAKKHIAKKTKMKKEKYNSSRASSAPIKIEINNLIAKNFKDKRGCFVVLDSEEKLTLKTLKKSGINSRKIEIPNYSDAYRTIKKTHDNTYNMTVGHYFDMIKDFGKNSIGGVWLDYMTTINGSVTENIYPKTDITRYFNYGLPKNNSMFAYTLSYRSKTSKDHSDMFDMMRFVQTKALENGYNLIPHSGKVYKGMFFQMFEVQKF